MRYIPHTKDDVQAMLKTIGIKSVSDLFDSVPADLRLKEKIPIPPPMSESEIRQLFKELADRNINLTEGLNFIGAGSYYHYVPSVIASLISRGELFTAYTPYQPEVSQGTLQAIFEFQTMMSELTGMEVANASNYDLSTACAEALLMAERVNKKKKALVSRACHPQYREVLKTYFKHQDYELVDVPFTRQGMVDMDFIKDQLDDTVGAVLVQSPNFFGVIEDTKAIGDLTKEKPALFVMATAESMSYPSLVSPGEAGADIAIAEGMSLGLGPSYGGPYLGVFATREQYLRSMPGRLVGRTTDTEGREGYVLTLATREQHIRRERATSNICTNQSLCAMMASIYLSLMGREGIKKISLLNMHRLRHLEALLKTKKPESVYFDSCKFNETVIELSVPAKDAVIHLLKDRIFAGVDLFTYYPEFDKHLLVCTTEMVSALDVEVFVERLSRFL